jgi:phosphoribosyl 1,2-cyclic phosphodiesterase
MALRFTVLASGSAGNAVLVTVGNWGVLLDAGLGPRELSSRLAAVGATWASVHAVLLTHTHGDHWRDTTLAHLHRRRVPFWCHPEHHETLELLSRAFPALRAAGLVRDYADGAVFAPVPGLQCVPVPVRHDGGATFGFRLEAGPSAALAYASDLGCWDDELADRLAGVDLLALEFNHEVELQYASGRHPKLIRRVLGDEGHLSNAQAADLLRAVLARSPAGRLRHLVQLHLSRECNRPHLARAAACAALAGLADGAEVHTARQDVAGPTLSVEPSATPAPPRAAPRRRTAAAPHPWLPGLESEAV